MKKTLFVAVFAILHCHFAELLAQNPKIKRVLFIGNSYTAVNDLPNWTRKVGEVMGDSFEVTSIAPGGRTFAAHSTDPAVLQELRSAQYDAVILQEQSQMPAFPIDQVETECFPYAKSLCDTARAYNPFVRMVFYSTWGRQNGDAANCQFYAPLCTFKGMNQLLHDRYLMMGSDNFSLVAPVTSAWRDLRDSTSINLYQPDGSHPTEAGTHVAANSIYRVLFGKDLKENGFKGSVPQLDHQRIINTINRLCSDSDYVWNMDSCSVPTEFKSVSINPYGKDSLLVALQITRFDPRGDYFWTFQPNIGNKMKKIVTSPNDTLKLPRLGLLVLNTRNACGTSNSSIEFSNIGVQNLVKKSPSMKWLSVSKTGSFLINTENVGFSGAILWSTLGQIISPKDYVLTRNSEQGELYFLPKSLNPGAYVLQLENGIKIGLWVVE